MPLAAVDCQFDDMAGKQGWLISTMWPYTANSAFVIHLSAIHTRWVLLPIAYVYSVPVASLFCLLLDLVTQAEMPVDELVEHSCRKAIAQHPVSSRLDVRWTFAGRKAILPANRSDLNVARWIDGGMGLA